MMESLPQPGPSKEMETTARSSDPCKEEDKTIAVLKYCFDCKESVISLLCSFQHTACKMAENAGHGIDVAKIQSESDSVISQMRAAIEHLELLQKMRIENEASFQQKLEGIRQDINQARDQTIAVMENVVGHVTEVTKQIEREKKERIETDVSRITKIKDQMKQTIALLGTIRQQGSEQHKFVSTHLIMKEFEEIRRKIQEEDKRLSQLSDAKLVLGDDLKKLIGNTDLKRLVQINVNDSEIGDTSLVPVLTPPMATVSNDLKDTKLVKMVEYIISSKYSPYGNYFTGISVCNDGRVIICNYDTGGYLHLYNPINRTNLKRKLRDGEDPFCAVQIDEIHLIASSGQEKTIIVLNIGNELRADKVFKTTNEPRTIIKLNNGHVAVAWNKPPAFGVIDISGKEIIYASYFEQDITGRKFESFEYLAVDERRKHVIQPCSEDAAVYCFDFTGNSVFKYTDPRLSNPKGVALDKCGNIYVCAHSSSSIHKLSPTGVLISVFTEGVPPGPQAICSDVTGTGFWVTEYKNYFTPSDKIVYFRLEHNA